jgi:hypothetical protein
VEAPEDVADDEEDDQDPLNEKDPPGKSNLENFKYYTSLFLGTLCLVRVSTSFFSYPRVTR